MEFSFTSNADIAELIHRGGIFFDVEGAATIAGVDNGCQTSMERFKDNHRKAFFGKCLVVLQSAKHQGNIKLTAKGVDLKEATLNIPCK